jgi:hypothetical protein
MENDSRRIKVTICKLPPTPTATPTKPLVQSINDMSSSVSSTSTNSVSDNTELDPSKYPQDDPEDPNAYYSMLICGTSKMPKWCEGVIHAFEKDASPKTLAPFKKNWVGNMLYHMFESGVTPPVSQRFAEAWCARSFWLYLGKQQALLFSNFHLQRLIIYRTS